MKNEFINDEDEKRVLEKIRVDTGTVNTGSYFNNLLPRVHRRLEVKEKKSWMFRTAYALPLLLAAVFIINNPFSVKNSFNRNEFEKAVLNLNAGEKAEIAEYVSDKSSVSGSEIYAAVTDSAAIEKSLYEALRLNDQEVLRETSQKYLDTDDLINDLSEEESGSIYSSLINKKVI